MEQAVSQKANRLMFNAVNLRKQRTAICFCFGLVVIATTKHPIPSRTRPLRAVTPMVLRLKTWESRSPPNLTKNRKSIYNTKQYTNRPRRNARAICIRTTKNKSNKSQQASSIIWLHSATNLCDILRNANPEMTGVRDLWFGKGAQ